MKYIENFFFEIRNKRLNKFNERAKSAQVVKKRNTLVLISKQLLLYM